MNQPVKQQPGPAADQVINFDPTSDQEARSDLPLHRQLFFSIRKQINDLELIPGQLMPSTRVLSNKLGVSRTTVVRAYEDLLGQGFVKAIDGVGTFVAGKIETGETSASEQKAGSVQLSRVGANLLQTDGQEISTDSRSLHYGAAPPEFLPLRQWRTILLKHSRQRHEVIDNAATEPSGYRPLRQAISSYLARTRALNCDVAQLAVLPGSLDALKLISLLLIDEHDKVLVENPGFTFARAHFSSLGAQIHAVPVDEEGIRIDYLHNNPQNAKLIYVTPSHQDSTGAVMSLERRRQLISWAKQNQTLIVEDDYNSEFRFSGGSIPALYALAAPGDVVYMSSFWKILHPLIDCSYLVVPSWLSPAVTNAIIANVVSSSSSLPLLEQYALTDFVDDGHFERHLRKTYPLYRSRWQAVVSALTKFLNKDVAIARESSASHVFVRFQSKWSDEEILRCGTQACLQIVSARSAYGGKAPCGEFIIPFAHRDENQINSAIHAFAVLLQGNTQQPHIPVTFASMASNSL